MEHLVKTTAQNDSQAIILRPQINTNRLHVEVIDLDSQDLDKRPTKEPQIKPSPQQGPTLMDFHNNNKRPLEVVEHSADKPPQKRTNPNPSKNK